MAKQKAQVQKEQEPLIFSYTKDGEEWQKPVNEVSFAAQEAANRVKELREELSRTDLHFREVKHTINLHLSTIEQEFPELNKESAGNGVEP